MSMNAESRGMQKKVIVAYFKVLSVPVRMEENYAKP
jgi:hypothetical protein